MRQNPESESVENIRPPAPAGIRQAHLQSFLDARNQQQGSLAPLCITLQPKYKVAQNKQGCTLAPLCITLQTQYKLARNRQGGIRPQNHTPTKCSCKHLCILASTLFCRRNKEKEPGYTYYTYLKFTLLASQYHIPKSCTHACSADYFCARTDLMAKHLCEVPPNAIMV